MFLPVVCLADPRKIFDENNHAVVVVQTFNRDGRQISQASGFIVRDDGAVVTNYHIISEAANIKVQAVGKEFEVKGLLFADKDSDIAVLKVEGKNLPTVKIYDSSVSTAGQKIYIIGSPLGQRNMIFDGTINRIIEVRNKNKIILITAPVTKSLSGGPLFNEDGKVIGIATFITEEAQPFYFAMSLEKIKDNFSLKKVIPLKDAGLTNYKETAEYWFNLGFAYELFGIQSAAAGAYQNAIRIKPDDSGYHHRLGLAYENLGIYSYAVKAYQEAIRIQPGHLEALYGLGASYTRLGMPEKALEVFSKIVSIKPDHIEAHLALGSIYSAQANVSALEEYRILKELDADAAEALHKLLVAKKIISAETPETSIENYTQSQTSPGSREQTPSPATPVAAVQESPPPLTKIASSEESHIPETPEIVTKAENIQNTGKALKKDIYSVQVNVFENKKNSDALIKRLKKKSYNAFVKIEYRINNSTRYRVLVGRFADKDEALKTVNIILKKEGLKSVLFKH